MEGEYCSPQGIKLFKETGTCFTREALVRMVQAWNQTHPDQPIKNVAKKTKKILWKELNHRMYPLCGKDTAVCWVNQLNVSNRPDVEASLRPEMPKEWYKNSHTWLTNWDIENVMNQYQDEKSYNYQFLGVFPIDFGSTDLFGKCLYQEMCSVNMAKLRKRGIQYLGAVFNLDRHDQGGSHWMSLFIVIDESLPSYGAYYSDSVGREPPTEIHHFMHQLSQQGGSKFQLGHNKIRQQYGNSECGMFSMAYQIRWLEQLKKNSKTTFKDIIARKMHDDDVNALRFALFRPSNSRAEIPVAKKTIQGAKKIING
jgi:hypothetical protein